MIWWIVGGLVLVGVLMPVVAVVLLGEHLWPLRRAVGRTMIRAEEALRLVERLRATVETLAQGAGAARSPDAPVDHEVTVTKSRRS